MPASQPPVDSRAVRERLVEALRLDLVGPWAGHELDAEQLPGRERPSNWYVAGFLIPTGTPPERSGDADEDDDLDAVPESAGLAEESNDERKAARKAFFPSSIGLSFLVAAGCRELAVTVHWGDYAPAEIEEAGGGKTPVWRRNAHEEALSVPLGGDAGPVVRDVPGSGGLQLHVVERPIGAMGTDGSELPAGTRSASCFLVNRRTPDEAQPDCAYAFQAEIEVRADEGFVPRPDLRGAHAAEWDDQVADRLIYTTSDCFETFPFVDDWETDPALEVAGRNYYRFRADLMVRNDEGLTTIYNRFHNPNETSSEIQKLRELHSAMDQAVLPAYGWPDAAIECEFLPEYETDQEDVGGRKAPYRYRWPDEVRDEILGRLLELNRRRAANDRK